VKCNLLATALSILLAIMLFIATALIAHSCTPSRDNMRLFIIHQDQVPVFNRTWSQAYTIEYAIDGVPHRATFDNPQMREEYIRWLREVVR